MEYIMTHVKPIRATLPPTTKSYPDPVLWLQENSGDKHAIVDNPAPKFRGLGEVWNARPRAAMITLVRNSELEGIMQSMRQLEARWNRKYQVRNG